MQVKLNKKNLIISLFVVTTIILILQFGHADITGNTVVKPGDSADLSVHGGKTALSFVAERPNPVSILISEQKKIYLDNEKNQSIKLSVLKELDSQNIKVSEKIITFDQISLNGYGTISFDPIKQSQGAKISLLFESDKTDNPAGVFLFNKANGIYLAPRIIYREYFKDDLREIRDNLRRDLKFYYLYLSAVGFVTLLVAFLLLFDVEVVKGKRS